MNMNMIHDEEIPQSLAGLLYYASKGFMTYARAQVDCYDGEVKRALRAIDNAERYSVELRSMRPNWLYTPDRIALIGDAQKHRIRAEFYNLTMVDELVQDYQLHTSLSKEAQAKRESLAVNAEKFKTLLLASMFTPTSRNREALNKFVKVLYKARRKSRKAGDLANMQDIDQKLAFYTRIARELVQVIRIAVGRVQGASDTYDAEGKSKSSYNLVIQNAQGSAATTVKEKAKVRVGLARKPKPLADEYTTWAELQKETTEKTGRAINRLPLRIASASTCRK